MSKMKEPVVKSEAVRAKIIKSRLSRRIPWLNELLGSEKDKFYTGVARLLHDHENIGYSKVAEIIEKNEGQIRKAINEIHKLKDDRSKTYSRLRPSKSVTKDTIANIVLSSVVIGYSFRIDPKLLLVMAGQETRFGSKVRGSTGDLGVWQITKLSALAMDQYWLDKTNRIIGDRIDTKPRKIKRISSKHSEMENVFFCAMVAGQTLMNKAAEIKDKDTRRIFSGGLEMENMQSLRVVGKYYNGLYKYGEELWNHSQILFKDVKFKYKGRITLSGIPSKK